MKLGEFWLTPELEEKFSGGFDWMKELRKTYYLYAEPVRLNGKVYALIEGREGGKVFTTIIDPEQYTTREELIEAVRSLLNSIGFPTKEEVRRKKKP